MNQPPHNPNRELTIKVMIIAGLFTLTLVVIRIATLGGDDTFTAFGKALIVVPLFIFILGTVFAIYYYRAVWLPFLLSFVSKENIQDKEKVEKHSEVLGSDNHLDMLRRIKELAAERNAVRAELNQLQQGWESIFGQEVTIEMATEGLQKMYEELEALRAAESIEQQTQLKQEILTKTSAAQELGEGLRESEKKVTQLTQHNEELLVKLNQATLKINLLEGKKAQLLQIAKQYTWREVEWEEFLASVNYGKDLLTDNRWGERIRQRIRKEGLILFGDPTVTALASTGQVPELPELSEKEISIDE